LAYPLPTYNSSCTAGIFEAQTDLQYPYCYSTHWDLVAGNRSAWGAYYEAVYNLRQAELDYAVAQMASAHSYMFDKKVFLMGTSEGGMIAARYNNPTLDSHLSGRFISSWSCEYNYFVSCEESAKICADGCNKDVPVVSIVSSVDPYFGPQSESVSYKVAETTGQYPQAGRVTGNCFENMVSQGFSAATSIVLPNSGHDQTIYYDNFIRMLFYVFLNAPDEVQDQVTSGPLLSRYCNVINQTHELSRAVAVVCDQIGAGGEPFVVPDGSAPDWEQKNCTEANGCAYYFNDQDIYSGCSSRMSVAKKIGISFGAFFGVVVFAALCSFLVRQFKSLQP